MQKPVAGASRSFRCGWVLVVLTAVCAASLIRIRGLGFPLGDAFEPGLFTLGLCGAAAIYRWRKTPEFEMALTSLALITTFTAFYSVLMYAIGSLPTPLADGLLQRWDAACGVHLPDIVAWAQAHPALNLVFRGAYDSVMLQTAGVIVLLSFTRDARNLCGFNLQFMIAALLTMVLFAFFPADGPCVCYNYTVDPGLDRYVQHLRELRSGARGVVTWRNAEGLVTFPSFHTTWAILLAWAVRRRRWLNIAAAGLNLAVIASTLTTGLHYFIDVPGGTLVAVAAIAVEARVWRWCGSRSPGRAPATCPGNPPAVETERFRAISASEVDELCETAREMQEA